MADISKITLPSGNTYFIKDLEARQMISQLNQFTYEVVLSLPSASEATMYKIYLISTSTPGEDDVYEEYITIDKGSEVSPRYVWEKLGTITAPDLTEYAKIEDLGALAYKDNASGSFTPAGNVSLTDTNKTATVGVAASGETTYQPGGTVSTPTISVETAGATTTVNSITDVGTLPSATMPTYTVSDEVLTITAGVFDAGTLPTKGADTTVKTGDATYESSQPTFMGNAVRLETGDIAVPTSATFTGTQGTVTVS